jgi:DNA topoisomerase IA
LLFRKISKFIKFKSNLGYQKYRRGGRYQRGRGKYAQDNNDYYDYYDESYDSYNHKYRNSKKKMTSAEREKSFQQKRIEFLSQFVHEEPLIRPRLEEVALEGEINVLVVTQRPAMARTFANAMAKDKITEFQGFEKSWPVYWFESKFKGMIANVKVTSVEGNMYNISFSKELDQNDIEPEDLYTQETLKDPIKKSLPKHIQLWARKADMLVLWTDPSVQGENIAQEIVDNAKHQLKIPSDDYIFRAKFKTLLIKDIQETFENLIWKPNEYKSLSYDAINTLDLKIQSSFSKLLTSKLFERFPAIEKTWPSISYNQCQAIALAMIAEREQRMKKFVPQQYFKINILIKQGKVGFKTHELRWKRDHVFSKSWALTIFDEIKSERKAIVSAVDQKLEQISRPLPLNTNKLMKVASENFGIAPCDALKIIESLYLGGYINYFLTNSTNYGKDFNFKEVLEAHQLHSEWGQYSLKLIEKGFEAPLSEERNDGLPIIPVKSAEAGKLNPQEWKIYQFITKNFLASISRNAIIDTLDVAFNIGDELFELNLKKIEDKGFLEIMPGSHTIPKATFPKFKILEEYSIDTKKVIDVKTSPPTYLTEAELINQFEAHKIGQIGVIAECLKDLVALEYITVHKRKNRILTCTKLGSALVKSLISVDPELVSSEIRSKIENLCSKIQFNEIDSVEVVNNVLTNFCSKLVYLKENFEIFSQCFQSHFFGKEDLSEPTLTEEPALTENLTAVEETREVVEKKHPQLKWRLCGLGVFKEIPAKISIHRVVSLKWGAWKVELKAFKDYEKFVVTNEGCEECGSAKVKLFYSNKSDWHNFEASPFPHHANQHQGCIYWDNYLRNLVEYPDSVKFKGESTSIEVLNEANENAKGKLEGSSGPVIFKKQKKKGRR